VRARRATPGSTHRVHWSVSIALVVALAAGSLSLTGREPHLSGNITLFAASGVQQRSMQRLTDYQLLVALRRSGVQYTWHADMGLASSSGACGTNRSYNGTTNKSFYVEQQSCAEEILLPAILDNDIAAIAVAFRALEWGFAREAPDGSFPGQADAFHSVSLFLISAARSMLILGQSPLAAQLASRINLLRVPILRAAEHLVRPDDLAVNRRNDAPYGHRRFLLGTAIGLAGDVSGAQDLKDLASGFMLDGAALQHPDGVIPERDGYDSHYQVYGMLFATRWLLYNGNDPAAPAVDKAIGLGIRWVTKRVTPAGEVLKTGNTRTAGQERNRDGTPKVIVYTFVARALAESGIERQDPSLLAVARQVLDWRSTHAGT
jgi:hypothetical protein